MCCVYMLNCVCICVSIYVCVCALVYIYMCVHVCVDSFKTPFISRRFSSYLALLSLVAV